EAHKKQWLQAFEKQRESKVASMSKDDEPCETTASSATSSVPRAGPVQALPPRLTLLSTLDINDKLAAKPKMDEALPLLEVLASRAQTASTSQAARAFRVQVVRGLCLAMNLDDWQAMAFVVIADFLINEIEHPLPDLETNRAARFKELKRRQLLLIV